jgi:hypothetical protein
MALTIAQFGNAAQKLLHALFHFPFAATLPDLSETVEAKHLHLSEYPCSEGVKLRVEEGNCGRGQMTSHCSKSVRLVLFSEVIFKEGRDLFAHPAYCFAKLEG